MDVEECWGEGVRMSRRWEEQVTRVNILLVFVCLLFKKPSVEYIDEDVGGNQINSWHTLFRK